MPRKKSKPKAPVANLAGRRYARKPDTLLAALGFEISRKTMAQFEAWRLYADFPKKDGNKGWDIEKIETFLAAHQDEFAQKAARARLVTEGGAVKSVRETLQGVHTGAPGADDDDEPLAKNQTAIANWLAHHFQVPVSKMDVSDWLRGERLDQGTPNFPVPDAAGRFNKLKCSDWFKKYKYREPSSQLSPDLFRQVEIESKKSELERFAHERFLRGVERGLHIEKAEHNRILSALGRIGRDNLWELFDRTAPVRLTEAMTAAGVPEDWRQTIGDIMRKLMPELLLKHHAHLEAVIQENEADIPKEKAKDNGSAIP